MKKILVALFFVALISILGYYFYYQRQPHYIITATEKVLRDGMMLPSSFEITEAVFTADSGKGIVLIKMIYKNKFGGISDSYVILNYAAKKIEKDESSALKKQQYEIFQNEKEKVKNGQLNIEPFSKMNIVSASINERAFSEIDFISLNTYLLLEKKKYNGPSLGGKIIELRDDGKHKFDFPTLRYIPAKLLPYEKG